MDLMACSSWPPSSLMAFVDWLVKQLYSSTKNPYYSAGCADYGVRPTACVRGLSAASLPRVRLLATEFFAPLLLLGAAAAGRAGG